MASRAVPSVGHVVAGEDRPHVEVVVDEMGGDDDVADRELVGDAPGRTGEHDALDAEVLDEQRRRRGDGGLPDAGDHGDRLVAVEDARGGTSGR